MTAIGAECPTCKGRSWEPFSNPMGGMHFECSRCGVVLEKEAYVKLRDAPKPKNHFVIMTTFGLNLALVTHKTIAELQKEVSTEAFLDCDNALVRCALIVAIMPQPAPDDPKQQATDILQGLSTEGVKAQ